MDSAFKSLCPLIIGTTLLAVAGTAAAPAQPPDDWHILDIEPTFQLNITISVESLITPEELGATGSSIALLQQNERTETTAPILLSMVLMELDSSGAPVWQTPIAACPGPPTCPGWNTRPRGVTRGRNGYMVVGTVDGGQPFAFHLFLAYFKLDGAISWLKLYDRAVGADGLGAYGEDIVYLGDSRRPPGPANPDEFMVLGSFESSLPAEGKAWIFRVDPNGNVLGTGRQYLGQGIALPWRLRKARTAGAWLVGKTYKLVNDRVTPARGWVLKLDPAGTAEWERFYFEGAWDFDLRDIAEGAKSLLTIGSTHVASLEKTAMAGIPGEARWGLRVPPGIWPWAIDSRDFIVTSLRSPDQLEVPASTGIYYETSLFAVAGTLRLESGYYYPWLAQLSEDGRVLWQKSYKGSGFATCVAFSPKEEILAGGSWDVGQGLFISSLTWTRHSPNICSTENHGAFSPTCLKSEVGPKSSEPLDVQVRDFASRPTPPVRIQPICPAEPPAPARQ